MADQSPNTDIRTEEEKSFDALVRSYADIPEPVPEKDNPDALFANGWGRRGHFALLVAPSGIGKSVISTQLFVPWADGKPGLVGSAPLMPLHIAVIQAEDDDTEMAEFRRDHRMGHVAEGMALEDVIRAEKKVMDWSPFFRGKTGDAFLRSLELALRRQPMDVLILNPLQSYTDIDLGKNKEMTEFLRNGIDPVLHKYRVFMLCVHHTNKPQIDKSKGGSFGDDATAAYVGAGGAELTNYARSVTFIRRCTEKESKLENSFMLIGAKRGNRLGWKDADGKKTIQRIIAYSEDYIHWRIPSEEEITAIIDDVDAAITETPAVIAEKIAGVIIKDKPKKGVNHYCRDKLRGVMTQGAFSNGWQYLIDNSRDFGLQIVQDSPRAYHFEPIAVAAEQSLPGFQPPPVRGESTPDYDDLYDNDSQPYARF